MSTLALGDWTLDTVEAGYLWLDGGAMFGSVPKPLWSRTNPADERNRIRLAMRCLLLEGHGRRVLVEEGAGAPPRRHHRRDSHPPPLRSCRRVHAPRRRAFGAQPAQRSLRGPAAELGER